MNVGDLVRYVSNPRATLPHVIPKGEEPLGIVISIDEKLIGDDPRYQSIMSVVRVIWSDPKWNGKEGSSEEYAGDLIVIQCA